MRQVMWASVRVYGRRYVATVVAVVVGVGFVVVTGVLASAARNGLLADAAAQYAGAGTVVSDIPDLRTARRVLAGAPGTASANAQTYQPLSVGGRTLTDTATVGSVSTAPSLRWQRLTAGAFPTGVGQALADAGAAGDNGVRVGDRVTVGRGQEARQVTVTGLARPSSGRLAAPLYLTWADVSAFHGATFVFDVVDTSTDVGAVRAAVPHRLTVDSTRTFLQRVQAELAQGVDVVAVLLLVFAAIAFFVSALVIANTFAILLAQRARDFALLRCVGATRRQVRRSVLAESLVVAAVSATAGVLAGLGVGRALVAVAGRVFPALPTGSVTVSAGWLGGAWLLGVLVTVGSSLLPALRGTRVSPMAALRPDTTVDVRSAAGRWRLGAAVVALGGGLVLLLESMASHSIAVLLAGGAVNFVGVLLLGPVLVPAAVRLLGLVVGRSGVPGRIAAANAVRNPRRTAATAASLLVGVTLVSGLVTGMATVRSTVDREMDVQFPLDLTLTGRHALDADVLGRVEAVRGVAGAAVLRGVDATVTRGRTRVATGPLLGLDAASARVLRAPAPFGSPRRDAVYLPWDALGAAHLSEGARVTVRVGTRERSMRVRAAEGIGEAGVVSVATLDDLAGGAAAPRAVWALASDRADATDLRSAVTTVGWAADADVQGGLERRADVDRQLDVVTATVVTMLGAGMLIAVVGIGSTIGLSVLERAREHAVLRALGLTRRQLRGMLAVEAVLLATVAGVLGVALGAAYAFVGVHAVVGTVADDVTLVLPSGQLVLLVLAAGTAGLVACLLPARRAARIAPAAGLTAD